MTRYSNVFDNTRMLLGRSPIEDARGFPTTILVFKVFLERNFFDFDLLPALEDLIFKDRRIYSAAGELFFGIWHMYHLSNLWEDLGLFISLLFEGHSSLKKS